MRLQLNVVGQEDVKLFDGKGLVKPSGVCNSVCCSHWIRVRYEERMVKAMEERKRQSGKGEGMREREVVIQIGGILSFAV